MKRTISQDKAFKILEWIFFIGFGIVAGWFASGVLEKFFSRKTGWSQHEKEDRAYPVVVIVVYGHNASEVNLNNVEISYEISTITADGEKSITGTLKLGNNYLHNKYFNKTETVILESLENYYDGNRAFRIIHTTPIKGFPTAVMLKIYTKLERKPNLFYSDTVSFYLTSLNNSLGFYKFSWTDGKPFQISMGKNTQIKCNIQTQMTEHLKQTNKCQKESYYKCIASQIDVTEFNECSNKCIPEIFKNMGTNYTTPFCQNDTNNQRCILANKEVGMNCEKSCSIKEYIGETYLNSPRSSDVKDRDLYYFKYRLNNLASKVYVEYLIYDSIGMVGSVGGTLGKFSLRFCESCNFFLILNFKWYFSFKFFNIF